MKAFARKDPSNVVPARVPLYGRPPAGPRLPRLQVLARWLAWGLALMGLLGCGVFQAGGSKPATEPTQPGAGPASSTAPAAANPAPITPTVVELTPSPMPSPSFTPTAIISLPPSLTPFPSLTPQPTFDVSHYTPSPTPANVSALQQHCCTLRVHNGGPISLWIGRKLPKNGIVIKPRWYVEFYVDQPKTMTVYWCLWVDRTKVPDDDLLGAPVHGSDNLFDCRHQEVYVGEGLTEIHVVP